MISEKEKEVAASTNEKVAEAYVDNQVAEAKDKAIALADAGRHEDAVRELKKLCVTIESRNKVWASAGVTARNQKFLTEVEYLDRDKGLTNRNRKAWRSDSYQIQSQQRVVLPSKK